MYRFSREQSDIEHIVYFCAILCFCVCVFLLFYTHIVSIHSARVDVSAGVSTPQY